MIREFLILVLIASTALAAQLKRPPPSKICGDTLIVINETRHFQGEVEAFAREAWISSRLQSLGTEKMAALASIAKEADEMVKEFYFYRMSEPDPAKLKLKMEKLRAVFENMLERRDEI